MARRSKGRGVCLQMLYQVDMNPDVEAMTVREMIDEQISDEALQEFTWNLFSGVLEQRNMLDEKIIEVAENWSLHRMPPTDRNILRMGCYELFFSDVPPRVVIDEAIELAKKFGTAQSSQFINGILDRLIPEQGDISPES